MIFKNYTLCILLFIVLIISLNLTVNIVSNKHKGGVELIETYEIKLKKSKDNYRVIIHNIIRMEKILEYNKNYSNNSNFSAKFNYLKLIKNKEYSNLINILGSIHKATIINDKLKQEEKEPAEQYARLYIANQIQLKKYSNTTSKYIDIDNEINNIELLEHKDVSNKQNNSTKPDYKKKLMECQVINNDLKNKLKNIKKIIN